LRTRERGPGLPTDGVQNTINTTGNRGETTGRNG
jgi:hypothetical protein